MSSKTQILLIHGGMTFKNRANYLRYLRTREITLGERKRWTGAYLTKTLGPRYEIIRPQMPMKENARYDEWKIHFERYIPHLRANCVLIGNSLGGIFLAKYLSENIVPKKIRSVFLVCPPFDGDLPSEDLAGGFVLKKNLTRLNTCAENLHLLFSKDDDVVPAACAEKYRAKLPNAHIVIYKSKNGHFKISTFPEIVRMIQNDIRL